MTNRDKENKAWGEALQELGYAVINDGKLSVSFGVVSVVLTSSARVPGGKSATSTEIQAFTNALTSRGVGSE
jgi:hypothetical protein